MSTGTDELAAAIWRKSSRSNGQGNCVEIAFLPSGRVAIRESEAPDQVITTSRANWEAFQGGVVDGDFQPA